MENLVGNMLQGQVYVFYDSVVDAHFRNKLVGDLVGVAVEQTEPLDLSLLCQTAQKLGELVFSVKIDTVASGVLSYDSQLLYPEIFKVLCLADEIVHGAGAEFSADVGNCTVGAAVVAALCDLQVRRMVGSGQNSVATQLHGVFVLVRGISLALGYSLDRVHDVVDTADAQNRVNLGELLEDRVAIALGQTARDDDALQIFVFLEPTDVDNVVDGLLFCAFDEGAGVYNYNVCLGLLSGDLVSRLSHVVEHYLGVQLIFGTAERYKSYFQFVVCLSGEDIFSLYHNTFCRECQLKNANWEQFALDKSRRIMYN